MLYYGLQHFENNYGANSAQIRALLGALAVRFSHTSHSMNAQEVSNALYGLRRMQLPGESSHSNNNRDVGGMRTDAEDTSNAHNAHNTELLALLSVLEQKVTTSSGYFNEQSMSSALNGLQVPVCCVLCAVCCMLYAVCCVLCAVCCMLCAVLCIKPTISILYYVLNPLYLYLHTYT
jgi:hypothetical protein